MKKLFLFSIILLSGVYVSGQQYNSFYVVADSSTAFGRGIPAKTLILQQNTRHLYFSTEYNLGTKTLHTASGIKQVKVDSTIVYAGTAGNSILWQTKDTTWIKAYLALKVNYADTNTLIATRKWTTTNFLGLHATADSAVLANHAWTSHYADSSNLSNHTWTSHFADSAVLSNHARTSHYADSANLANHSWTTHYADSSGKANLADTANLSNHSWTTHFADSSVLSNHAWTSHYADSSNLSNHSWTTHYSDSSAVSVNSYTLQGQDTTWFLDRIKDSIGAIVIPTPDSSWVSITATTAGIDTLTGGTVINATLNLPYLTNSSTRSLIVKANGDVDSVTQTDINTYLGANIITSATITTLSTSRIPNMASYINTDSLNVEKLVGVSDGQIPLQTSAGVIGRDTIMLEGYQATKLNATTLYVINSADSLTIANNGANKFTFNSNGDSLGFSDIAIMDSKLICIDSAIFKNGTAKGYIKQGTDSLRIASNKPIKINNDVNITGQVKWQFPHGVAYYGDTTTGYTPAVTKLVYTKITPTFTNVETDYITMQGDSIIIVKPGDYEVNIYTNLTGGTNDRFRLTMFKNKTNVGIFNSSVISGGGAGVYVGDSWSWYFTSLVAGDYLDFRITNATDSDDPTFFRIKYTIKKLAE